MNDEPAPLRRALMVMVPEDHPPANPDLADDPAVDAAPVASPLPPPALRAMAGAAGGRMRAGLAVFASLFVLVLASSAWSFVAGLFAAHAVLGWLGLGLVAAALALVVWAAWSETLAYLRLGRIDALRAQARAASAQADMQAARAVLADLQRLYAGRGDMAWALAQLRETRDDILDADALLAQAERSLMPALDAAALAQIEAAARQVATVTALVPLALADVAAALLANLRLIRQLAQIYGGRSGSLGSWRLMRRVAGALLGAGAVALADDLMGAVAGGGVLAKLSRRFGEGVVNGALTARVGIAAMELSRPLPFTALSRPSTSAVVSRALAGMLGQRPKPGAES